MFLVASFGFLPKSKAIFWCNPCVGKVDTASFWSIPWWKCGRPVAENTLVLIGKKETEGNTRKERVFKGKGRMIKGEHRIIKVL